MGYVTISGVTAGKYVALGTQFEDVAGTNIKVADAVKASPGQSASSSTGADQIWRWNTATASWTKYYLCNNRGDIYWAYDGGRNKVLDTDTIPAGETFFFLRGSGASTTEGATLTLAGGVKDLTGNTAFSVTAAQLAFACNPWPIDLKISSFTSFYQPEGAPICEGSSSTGADQVWLWNTATSGWTKYYACNNRGEKYWSPDGKRQAVTDDDVVPAGRGFFFQRGSSASATQAAIVKIEMPK